MLGNFDKNKKKVVIIGAGITGLLCGFFLKREGYSVEIIEQSGRVGGLIKTKETDFGSIEYAAHIIKLNKTLRRIFLCLKVKTNEMAATRRLFLIGSKATSFPVSFKDIVVLLFRLLFMKKIQRYDSLEHFLDRHFGRGFRQKIFTPMLHGIYAAPSKELSSKIMFKEYQKCKIAVPLIVWFVLNLSGNSKRKEPIVLIDGGAETLTRALHEYLKGEVRLNTVVSAEYFKSLLQRRDTNVIVCTQASESFKITGNEELGGVRYKSVTHLWVFFKRSEVERMQEHERIKCATGILSANVDKPFLGCLFNGFYDRSDKKNSDKVLVTAIFDTEKLPGAEEAADGHLDEQALLKELQEVCFKNLKPLCMTAKTTRSAIPLYENKLMDYAEGGGKDLPYLICSNYCGFLSISKIAQELERVFVINS